MKKLLFTVVLVLGFTIGIHAQSDNESEDEIDYSSYELNQSQSDKINEINIEYAKKFKAVGQDRSLLGQEKGQKKRALAIEKRKKIKEVLSSGSSAENTDYSFTYNQPPVKKYTSKEAALRGIEAQLLREEAEYLSAEATLKETARDTREYKRRADALKEAYKRRKAILKAEKEAVKKSFDN